MKMIDAIERYPARPVQVIQLLVFCYSFAFSGPAAAQNDNYQPLVVEDRTWSVLTYEWVVVNPDDGSEVTNTLTEHFRIAVDQDSIVDGKVWHLVYTSRDTSFDWNNPDLDLIGIIREEDRRVYYRGKYSLYSNTPIFDFNLLPGDTIEKRNNDIDEPIFFVVTDIDTVILDDGISRSRFHTGYWHRPHGQASFDFYPTDIVWVEGIGDLTHGLLPQPGFQLNNLRSLDRLLCVTNDQTSSYTHPEHTSCFQENILSGWSRPIELPIHIFPNPVVHQLHLENLEALPPGILCITDLLGRVQFQRKLDGGLPDLQINVADWPVQTYLLNYSSHGLGRFHPLIFLKMRSD